MSGKGGGQDVRGLVPEHPTSRPSAVRASGGTSVCPRRGSVSPPSCSLPGDRGGQTAGTHLSWEPGLLQVGRSTVVLDSFGGEGFLIFLKISPPFVKGMGSGRAHIRWWYLVGEGHALP